MRFAVFFASILTLVAVPALATLPTRTCGTTHFDAAAETRNQQFIQAYSRRAVHTPLNRSVPVYWHTIHDGSLGLLSSSQIQSQIDVLNQDYAKAGYSFHLVGSDWTHNADWFYNMFNGSFQERAMKTLLRRGGADTLNIYTMNFNNIVGFSALPQNYASGPWRDGVVIYYATLPGGGFSPFDLGRTATHEIGHWLGLLHVFEGGCSGNGDFVSDTPPQVIMTSGCPSFQDSCPGGGADSIHNFMDYTDDACMNQFTKRQIMRMHALTQTYRGI
ncbi:unnamed protein product [Tilletia controversa]|uniref:Peptidase M43 pregnancy-associated plasma-A domain-containing protein n=3 Tax=Tilletia TaxID=13289 RepID=A0A8X7MYI9_9BASI|nr:hypothetical protein CF336_g1106 [Tilletia laevis]KAE8204515.1 hypothetical protein CF328_g1045 [Tilletia controversa]KAE8264791.1 hypothetical protein A4X03_0g705 [Tilletia caries]KAE8208135.1 hypothetical protein CF335_g628 [Tilletia laevis]KAE8253551.1 hypothetical protein A4X06_0g1375 [Tilletia controversa]